MTKTDFDAKLKKISERVTSNKTAFAGWKWTEKTKNIWFKLFQRQRPFWRRWHTKLFSVSANEKIF